MQRSSFELRGQAEALCVQSPQVKLRAQGLTYRVSLPQMCFQEKYNNNTGIGRRQGVFTIGAGLRQSRRPMRRRVGGWGHSEF
jgi:hypothetical protein